MVLCIRLHDGNPWVLQRLKFILSYYDPKPEICVLDFGSKRHFSELIQSACSKASANYIYQENDGTYSAALARNIAAKHVKSEYIFFCDIDCVGEADLFGKFYKLVSAIKCSRSNTYVLPVYHFNEQVTKDLTARFLSPKCFDQHITSCFSSSIHAPFNADNSYIAPYSNVFLIHRDIFNESGGYDPRFIGHGSEDFEFLLRLAIQLKVSPLPVNLDEDCFGPLTPGFFDITPYRGFRKLLETMATPAELAGLRVGHLWHPRPTSVAWHGENDSSRRKFSQVVSEYLGSINYENSLVKTHNRSYIAYRANFYNRKEVLYSVVSDYDYTKIENIARNELMYGNYGLAAAIFLRSYKENPNRVTPLLLAYKCFMRIRDFRRALECISTASQARPNSKRIFWKFIIAKCAFLFANRLQSIFPSYSKSD